jgi:hypothetical protein
MLSPVDEIGRKFRGAKDVLSGEFPADQSREILAKNQAGFCSVLRTLLPELSKEAAATPYFFPQH